MISNGTSKTDIICLLYLHFVPYDFVSSYIWGGQSWRRGTKCNCKTDWLWVRSLLEDMKYLLKFPLLLFHYNLYFHFFALGSKQSGALSSAIQHAIPPEFDRKWGTESLNTNFPLPIMLCAGYSVKLIFIYVICNITFNNELCASASLTLIKFEKMPSRGGGTSMYDGYRFDLVRLIFNIFSPWQQDKARR